MLSYSLRLIQLDKDFLNLHYLGGFGTRTQQLNGVRAKMSSEYRSSTGATKCLKDDAFICHSKSVDKKGPKWLEVEFDRFIAFTLALVLNRKDCCQNRFRKYTMHVGSVPCGASESQVESEQSSRKEYVGSFPKRG